MLRRRANIIVENHTTSTEWEAINVVYSSGNSEGCLPLKVLSKESLKFVGVQQSFSIFTGTAGVFTYSILRKQKDWKTLAVMWDVPFDYNIYRSNYWNVEVIDKKRVLATRDLFWKMRGNDKKPVKGVELDCWKAKVKTHDFIVKGCMTSSSNSTLHIEVSNNAGTRKESAEAESVILGLNGEDNTHGDVDHKSEPSSERSDVQD